jgi:hypothetical protein
MKLKRLLGSVALSALACLTITACGGPSSVVPGKSQASFQSYIKGELNAKPFYATGVTSVDCTLPHSWTTGTTFTCTGSNSGGTTLGLAAIAIEPTQSGNLFNIHIHWAPS